MEDHPSPVPPIDQAPADPELLHPSFVYELTPHLFGKKFGGEAGELPRLPLESLRELLALRDVLIEAAKVYYRRSHASREKLPPGFDSSISVSLTAIQPGCVAPALRVHVQPRLRVVKSNRKAKRDASIAEARSICDSYRASLDSCLRLVVGNEDQADQSRLSLVPDVARAASQLGASFDPDDKMSIVANVSNTVIEYRDHFFNLARKRTLQDSLSIPDKVIDAIGVIRGVVESGRCQFKLFGAPKLITVDFQRPPSHEIRRALLLRCVRLSGIATWSSDGVLAKVHGVEKVSVIPNKLNELIQQREIYTCPISVRKQIRQCSQALKRTDFGHQGPLPEELEINVRMVESILTLLDSSTSMVIPRPFIYPTLEHGIQAEWDLRTWRTRATFSLRDESLEIYQCNLDHDSDGTLVTIDSYAGVYDTALRIGQILSTMIIREATADMLQFDLVSGEESD